jgi:ABC-type sugar transport system ATPase subunit
MAELELNSVYKSFDGQCIVEDFNLAVANGEFLVLLGPSGCGKSTLLRMIAGLEPTDGGQITLNGIDISNLPPRDRDIAMVFQNYALYPHMTVFENIAFPLKMRKLSTNEIDAQVRKAADLLGLSEMLGRKPRTLSGGQRQRVAVGRAIVRHPKLFLFDEPLSNLDAKLRVSMRTEILRLMREVAGTVIYVTHDQEEALTMGDRIAVLHNSKMQQVGTPKEIYDNPSNTFVARFVGSPRMNLLKVEPTIEGGVTLSDGTIIYAWPGSVDKASGSMLLGFRPQSCNIVQKDGISLRVLSSEYLGSDRYLFGKFGDEELIVRIDPTLEVPVDSTIRIIPCSDSILLFNTDGNRIR